jgi:Uma2 family endonuclease
MSTTTGFMTVAEFRESRDPPGAYYELRHGEAVAVTRPKWGHFWIQGRLHDLVRARVGTLGMTRTEFAFRPSPEYELWAADVAYARGERCGVDSDDNFPGAPDLVIEVLSPSNTAEEMEDRKSICLDNGALEFWVVSPEKRTVTVYTTGTQRVYKRGSAVPVDRFFPGQPPIPVEDVFADAPAVA